MPIDTTAPFDVEIQDDSPEAFDELQRFLESRRGPAPAKATWAGEADHPDYAHLLPAKAFGFWGDDRFRLTPQCLDLLISANSFVPVGPGGTFVFALRGLSLVAGDAHKDVTSVDVAVDTPDHLRFHCTIGTYNTATRTLSAYRASTVPNFYSMLNYWLMFHHQPSHAMKSNLLATGLYAYRVGEHVGASSRVNPALLLSNPNDLAQRGPATVMRTREALQYDFGCDWDPTLIDDNLHCAHSLTSFSSAGCMTVKGQQGQPGPWTQFQQMLLPYQTGSLTRFDVMLLTGREAAIAAKILAEPQDRQVALAAATLRRLRTGSKGPAADRLRARLGTGGTGELDGNARLAIVENERKDGRVKADSIYSPEDDAVLGWGIFAPAAVAPAASAAASTAAAAGARSPAPATENRGISAAAAGFDLASLVLTEGPADSTISPDGKTLISPGEGTYRVDPPGHVGFVPDPEFSGITKPVRYRIKDASGQEASAPLTITIVARHQLPQIAPGGAQAPAGRAVYVAVLAHDHALDGADLDQASVRLTDPPPGASLTADAKQASIPNEGVWSVETDGSITFRPFAGFLGATHIGYSIKDSKGAEGKSAVSAIVDPAPRESPAPPGAAQPATPVVVDVVTGAAAGLVLAPPTLPAVAPAPARAAAPAASPVAAAAAAPAPAPTTPLGVTLTEDALKRFINPRKPNQINCVRALVALAPEVLAAANILASPLRLCHFLAQIAEESGNFSDLVESMRYSAAQLHKFWPSRFPTLADAEAVVGNDEAVGNAIYGNRADLGNTQEGDGYRYIGRGIMQLTGRANYKTFGEKLSLPLEASPDLAADVGNAVHIAVRFWADKRSGGRSCNQLADLNDIAGVTRAINGGTIGLPQRKQAFAQAWRIWGTGELPSFGTRELPTLMRGDEGPAVSALQEQLRRAGYSRVSLTGIYDGETERAIVLVQARNGLNVSGAADPHTVEIVREIAAGRMRDGTAAPNDRRAPSSLPPEAAPGGERDGNAREYARLAGALCIVAAAAVAVLTAISVPDSSSAQTWLTLPLALIGAFLLAAAFFGSRRRPAHVGSAPAPVADSRAEDDAPILRKFNYGEKDFVDLPPVHPERAGADGGAPSEGTHAGPATLEPQGGSVPVAEVGGQQALPFKLAAPDADFAAIVLFGGDNNLSYEVERSLAAMAAANVAGAGCSVLALADVESAPASVIEITPAGERRTIETLGQIDSGDPEVLAQFLSRALVSYTRARIAIGFWDHGSGVFDEHVASEVLLSRSIAGRQAFRGPARRLFVSRKRQQSMAPQTRAMLHTNAGTMLTNLEAYYMLRAAFSRAARTQPVDLIYSDTCLNGMIEVLAELGPYARCVVGSCETEPSDGWDYRAWFGELGRQRPATAELWGKQAIAAFGASYGRRADQFPCTLGAFRSSNSITEAFAAMIVQCQSIGLPAWMLLNEARGKAQQYNWRDSYDLIDFADRLGKISPAPLAHCVDALAVAARQGRVDWVKLGSTVASSEGIAFWFPASRRSFEADGGTYAQLDFDRRTGWSRYLAAMYGVGGG